MFVLKLCGWYPSRVDQLSGDFVQRQAIAIATQVKTVVLFAKKDPGMTGGGFELQRRINGNLYEYIYYYPQKPFADALFSQWYYLRILHSFIKLMLKEHGPPAIMHLNIVWKAAIWVIFLRQKYRWPLVVTENSTEYQANALENIRTKGFLRRTITKEVFQVCRLFIPVSEQLGETINGLYGKIPYEVVPNVVDTSLFYPGGDKQKDVFRFLHVSTMGHQKNFEGLVRSLAKFAELKIPFEIVFVGPDNGEAAKTVNSYQQLAGKYRFTGPVTYEMVANYMRASDCLLLFSRYENLPCVILEALCCGLPVISTKVGGVPEIVNELNGLLVNDGDEQALVTSMKQIATGKRIFDRKLISESATTLYNYHTVGQTFMKVYSRVFTELRKT